MLLRSVRTNTRVCRKKKERPAEDQKLAEIKDERDSMYCPFGGMSGGCTRIARPVTCSGICVA